MSRGGSVQEAGSGVHVILDSEVAALVEHTNSMLESNVALRARIPIAPPSKVRVLDSVSVG